MHKILNPATFVKLFSHFFEQKVIFRQKSGNFTQTKQTNYEKDYHTTFYSTAIVYGIVQ